MAVEQLFMMNVVGRIDDLKPIVLDILNSKSVNLVNALRQLESNRDIYALDTGKVEQLLDLNHMRSFIQDKNILLEVEEAKEIMDYLNLSKISFSEEDLHDDVLTPIDNIYEIFKNWIDEETKIKESLDNTKRFNENFSRFQNVDIELDKLTNMDYFETSFGLLNKDGRNRMKQNYGNMLAFVFHIGAYEEDEVYMVIYPKEVREEIDRILKSLGWLPIDIGDQEGTAREIVFKLTEEQRELETRLEEINIERNKYIKENEDIIIKALKGALLRGKVEESLNYMAYGEKYFCLSGWVSNRDGDILKDKLSKYKDIIINLQNGESVTENPPTKLRNNAFFKPFETLIKMYGVPNYNEIDPTTFVGLTYLILFGSMFGDVGQGGLFALAGLLLGRVNKAFGGLLLRMGISSTIFGFLYGSVFGSEELLPAIWMRPFENINQVLMISIGFGVILLSISYILGILNAFKMKNKEEAYFGKEGITGFIIFLTFIFLAIGIVTGKSILPTKIAVGIIVLGLLISVFKKPLMAKLEREIVKYPKNDKTGYYIESSFSLLEMLISILSGTVSFIRVGAFAINHVGLFMAFQTMSSMMTNKLGSLLILILGNILIIFLEGLIVFIQGLRLEYYELFSRYYHGDGYEFRPAELNEFTKEK